MMFTSIQRLPFQFEAHHPVLIMGGNIQKDGFIGGNFTGINFIPVFKIGQGRIDDSHVRFGHRFAGHIESRGGPGIPDLDD